MDDKLNQKKPKKTKPQPKQTENTTKPCEEQVYYLDNGIVIHPNIKCPLLTHFKIVKLSNITLTAGEY